MKPFEIFADSAANLPDELVKERNIRVIPYICTVDGKDMSTVTEEPFRERAKAFYAAMRAGADVHTSLLTCETFIEALSPALEAGQDAILVTLSSGISGTYREAQRAAEELEKRYAGRKVIALDSANASLAEGLLVLRLADLRDMGESMEACAHWFEANRFKYNSHLTVGDLKYLKKGGRISAAACLAGTILGIKPIIRADGSAQTKLVMAGKERGRKKAIAALVRAFDENSTENTKTVAIAHGDCEEEALALAEELKAHGATDVLVEYYDICTGSHVGPDTIAIFFMGKDRRKDVPAPAPRPQEKGVPAKAKI